MQCIYCGQKVRYEGADKGEHIIPKSLYGTKKIQQVCQPCNNGFLSILDNELVCSSPLVNSRQAYFQKNLKQCWDVDYDFDNLLLEAQPSNNFSVFTLWPQIVFINSQPQLRGDAEQFIKVGGKQVEKIFSNHLTKAIDAYNSGSANRMKGLFFEKPSAIPQGFSYPPRIFARKHVQDFNDGMTFVCGYASNNDKNTLLKHLHNQKFPIEFGEPDVILGSKSPVQNQSYIASAVIRALTKIGINLLIHVCKKTVIDRHSFSESMNRIRYGIRLHNKEVCLLKNGFVPFEDMQSLNCPTGCHKFRLIYYPASYLWVLYCSFFGGDINAKVEFIGQSQEEWTSIDRTVPLQSANWKYEKSTDSRRIQVGVGWPILPNDLIRSLPPVTNFQSKQRTVIKAI